MADTKISALPASTTPLAGTEVLPVVQSGATKQVSVANLTAGRAVAGLSFAAGDATSTQTLSSTGIASSGSATDININLTPKGVGAVLTGRRLTVGDGVYYSLNLNGSVAQNPQIAWQIGGNARFTLLNAGTESGSNAGGDLVMYRYTDAGSYLGGVLTITRSTGNITLMDGNLVQGTAAKGINFTANSAAAGKTSQLLNWYEEGTWTATLTGSTAAPTTPVTTTAKYTRIGRQVTVSFTFANVTTTGASGNLQVTGLPFTAGENAMGVTAVGSAIPSAYPAFQLGSGSTTMNMIQITNGSNIAIPSTTGVYIFCTITYSV